MNKSVLMIMGGALIVAIVVAMAVQMKLGPSKKNETVAKANTEVLVATKLLKTGETLKSTDARWEAWPDGAIFKGMIKRKDQVDENKLEVHGKPLKRDIESGEPITMQALIAEAKGGGNFLSATIAPGMRAVGVPVKAETSVGGFVAPGDYVDVILTYQVSVKGDAARYSDEMVQRFASETILSNVRVLAVDQNAKEDAREAKIVRTITVEVNKKGSQILAMATSMGTISLSLRRLGEKDTEADKHAPLTTDVTTSQVIKRIYGVMDKSKTTSNTVRLYSGSAVENIPVRATKRP